MNALHSSCFEECSALQWRAHLRRGQARDASLPTLVLGACPGVSPALPARPVCQLHRRWPLRGGPPPVRRLPNSRDLSDTLQARAISAVRCAARGATHTRCRPTHVHAQHCVGAHVCNHKVARRQILRFLALLAASTKKRCFTRNTQPISINNSDKINRSKRTSDDSQPRQSLLSLPTLEQALLAQPVALRVSGARRCAPCNAPSTGFSPPLAHPNGLSRPLSFAAAACCPSVHAHRAYRPPRVVATLRKPATTSIAAPALRTSVDREWVLQLSSVQLHAASASIRAVLKNAEASFELGGALPLRRYRSVMNGGVAGARRHPHGEGRPAAPRARVRCAGAARQGRLRLRLPGDRRPRCGLLTNMLRSWGWGFGRDLATGGRGASPCSERRAEKAL
eukprot:6201136-Pleurochrysis_carterae.AAC.2